MMNERGKSDSAIGAVKPANKAERSAAELVEQRAGTKGNADQQSTRRAQEGSPVAYHQTAYCHAGRLCRPRGH
jgi:RNA-directed DNA polymerase